MMDNNWIPVREKLPPERENVLCWYEYLPYWGTIRVVQELGIGYQVDGTWCGEVVKGQKAKVLAWMPLPEPPKMGLEV